MSDLTFETRPIQGPITLDTHERREEESRLWRLEQDKRVARAREILIARHEVESLEDLLGRAKKRLEDLNPSPIFD